MTVVEWLRQAYALHPEFAHEIETLAKSCGPALEKIAVAEGVQYLPLGGLLQPVLARIAATADAQMQARLDAWLESYVQARPDVRLGELRAGLLEIEEIPTPRRTDGSAKI